MNNYEVTTTLQKFYEDKRNGVKRGPLHLLKECLEEAGITAAQYRGLAKKYGNAPQHVLTTQGKGNTSTLTKHFRKTEVLAYIKQCHITQGESK